MPFGWSAYDLYFAGGAFRVQYGKRRYLWDFFSRIIQSLGPRGGYFNNGDITLGSIFIDGVQKVLSQQLSTPLNRNVAATARISGWNTDANYKFGGTIDEFKIYNRALSASEVQSRYSAGNNTGSSRIKNDYADIRFTSSDMSQELSFWQEADNKFWIKMPSLPNGNTTIRMLYGNASASASSDMTNTFVFGKISPAVRSVRPNGSALLCYII